MTGCIYEGHEGFCFDLRVAVRLPTRCLLILRGFSLSRGLLRA